MRVISKLLFVLLLVAFLLLFIASSSVLASFGSSPVMTVEANIFGPPAPTVEIEVPDHVFIGNVSKGGETDKIRVDINNTGNVPVTVTPELVNGSEKILSNLYFIRRTTDTYRQIGGWSINITAPSSGGSESDYFYMKLDLRTFNGNIDSDIIGKKADVRFVATQT